MTVVRDRKIRTALRTNQIAEFVTVTAWKKINILTVTLCDEEVTLANGNLA